MAKKPEKAERETAGRHSADGAEQEAVKQYFSATQAERNEVLRYSIEMRALDERVFIPVDFDLIKNDMKLFDELLAQHCKRKNLAPLDAYKMPHEEIEAVYDGFDPDLKKRYRVQPGEAIDENDPRVKAAMQLNYVAHNMHALEVVKYNEKVNGTKIFKYATYEEMESIYIFGDFKKEQIEHKVIVSNDGYLTPLQFDAMAEAAARFRRAGLKMATSPDMLRKV